MCAANLSSISRLRRTLRNMLAMRESRDIIKPFLNEIHGRDYGSLVPFNIEFAAELNESPLRRQDHRFHAAVHS